MTIWSKKSQWLAPVPNAMKNFRVLLRWIRILERLTIGKNEIPGITFSNRKLGNRKTVNPNEISIFSLVLNSFRKALAKKRLVRHLGTTFIRDTLKNISF